VTGSEPAPARLGRQDRLAIAVVVIAWLAVAIPFFNYRGYDDAFITLRHSYNLVTGEGLVYNPGETFLGTSAPGFALAVAIFSLPWPSMIPVVAYLLSSLALLACALAIYEYSRLHGARYLGLMGAIFFVTCPLAAITITGEMLVQCALTLWAFVLIEKGLGRSVAIIAAISCIVRPDAAIAAVAIFGVLAYKQKRIPWPELGICLAIVCTFYLAIWAIYGSPIPGSMSAKAEQREIGLWNDFWQDARYRLKLHALPLSFSRWSGPRATPDFSVIRYLLVLGVVGLLWQHRYWIKPMLWSLLVALFFTVTNPPLYHWYLIPLLFPLVVIAAMGADTFVRICTKAFDWLLREGKPRWSTRALQGGALLLLAPAIVSQVFAAYEYVKPARVAYIEIAEWLNDRVPEGTSVAHFEIGYLGYYSPDLKIVDILGLVHPSIASEVAAGNTFAAFDRYDPDVVLHHGVFHGDNVTHRPGFLEDYIIVSSVNGDIGPLGSTGNIYDIFMKKSLAQEVGLPSVPTIRTAEQLEAIERGSKK